MNQLRVRVVKFKPDHGAGAEFPFGLQISMDGLIWVTIDRYKVFDPCLMSAKELQGKLSKLMLFKEESVLWSSK